MKPGPGEELIGTITPHGIRLTRDTQRAQRAYRERERERAEAARTVGLKSWVARYRGPGRGRAAQRRAARSIEWRVSWSSDAPFRVHFAVARWTAPAADAAGLARTPRAARSPRPESAQPSDAEPMLGRRTRRVAVGPGERQPDRLEAGRGTRSRDRSR